MAVALRRAPMPVDRAFLAAEYADLSAHYVAIPSAFPRWIGCAGDKTPIRAFNYLSKGGSDVRSRQYPSDDERAEKAVCRRERKK
ncbi:hypothetical protein [Sphingomonas bisphenolicum]|uniref:hypothetical protein n=1 Tax=Sphingomonas bisphenolicum TaxID=296544 RepID=UPI0021C33D49|nr:hypothetical protein [Sphingomonas bisphenolicum]